MKKLFIGAGLFAAQITIFTSIGCKTIDIPLSDMTKVPTQSDINQCPSPFGGCLPLPVPEPTRRPALHTPAVPEKTLELAVNDKLLFTPGDNAASIEFPGEIFEQESQPDKREPIVLRAKKESASKVRIKKNFYYADWASIDPQPSYYIYVTVKPDAKAARKKRWILF